MRQGRWIVLGVILLSVTSGLQPRVEAEPEGPAGSFGCPGIYDVEDIGRACRRPSGVWEVFAPDGGSMGFTHGPDEVTPASHEPAITPRQPACKQPGDPYHAVVIYARASDDADRYATMASVVRDLVHEVNGLLHQEALAAGSPRDLKMLCAGGQVEVRDEALPTPMASASFSTIVSDLRARGYDDHRVKYWVWYDDQGACTCGGMGHVYMDDSHAVNNLNNGPANAVPMFAVSFGYTGHRIMMHESGHTMGAVQDAAPHSSGAAHCNDGYDIMCYDDGGPTSAYTSSRCSLELYDCGKDTYFDPRPGSEWLLANWNVGSALNRFLAIPGGNTAPYITDLSCAPATAALGASVTCTVRGGDADSTGIRYTFDWKDGSGTTSSPATGTVLPGTWRSASHAFAKTGLIAVEATATDDAASPLTSTATTTTVRITNVVPTMVAHDCAPASTEAGEPMSCTFHADDSSRGVAYVVDWGDGQTERVPATGFLTPGVDTTAPHTYAVPGDRTISVHAVDEDPEPLTSASLSDGHKVLPATHAPVMELLSCMPLHIAAGEAVSCSFRAGDDSSGLFYAVQWEAGAARVRVPASGTVAPGTTLTADHVYASGGPRTVLVHATDLDGKTSNDAGQGITVNGPPVVPPLECAPQPVRTGVTLTCTIRADDDSANVGFVIDWGDGSSPTTLPPQPPGADRTAPHVYADSGTHTLTVTATDDDPRPLATTATRNVEILPPCKLLRTAHLTLGLMGVAVMGVSARDETAIPASCWGLPYSGSTPFGDIDVCWYKGALLLHCDRTGETAYGPVPSGADRARVILMTGAAGQYTLRTFD